MDRNVRYNFVPKLYTHRNMNCMNIWGASKVSELLNKIMNAIFWDVAQCRSCVSRRFGGTYHLHLQGRNIRVRVTSVSRWLQYYLTIINGGIRSKLEVENLRDTLNKEIGL
jgi:hypothetical protein